jgi:hypothetical protein
MSSEVNDMIAAFRNGAMTLEEVAQRFRERSWPRTRRHEPQTYLEHATAAQQDPESDIPGSVDDIVAAYDRGELSYAQYRSLAEAAAEGMRREDARKETEQ